MTQPLPGRFLSPNAGGNKLPLTELSQTLNERSYVKGKAHRKDPLRTRRGYRYEGEAGRPSFILYFPLFGQYLWNCTLLEVTQPRVFSDNTNCKYQYSNHSMPGDLRVFSRSTLAT